MIIVKKLILLGELLWIDLLLLREEVIGMIHKPRWCINKIIIKQLIAWAHHRLTQFQVR